MNKFLHDHKRQLIEVLALLISFLFVIISYLVFKSLYRLPNCSDGFASRIYSYLCIAIWFVVLLILYFKQKLTFYRFVFMIFILGVLLRVAYMLVTPYNYRQHDTVTPYGDGHEDYARIIYETWKLPDNNSYQFYHPPLNAFCQAVWMNISKPLLILANLFHPTYKFDVSNFDTLFETTQMISCLYMIVVSYLCIKMVNWFKIKNKAKIFAIVFIVLFPRLVQFAAQENNDPIVVLFSTFTLYFTFRWWRKQSWFNVIAIGISIGLAMMGKLSGAIIAIVPAVVFIYDFVKSIKDKQTHNFKGKEIPNWSILIAKYLCMFVFAFSLGLWFSFYALKRFNQPIGYVWPMSPESGQYHGNINVFFRLINIFDFKDLFSCLYGNTFINYNLFNFTVRSSMFGEFSFCGMDGMVIVSTVLNYLFVLFCTVTFIIYLFKSVGEHFKLKIITSTLVVSQYGAQLYFNASYPFGCTMDFRYIVTIVIGYGFMGALTTDKFFDEKGYKGFFGKSTFALGLMMIATTSIFYLFSI